MQALDTFTSLPAKTECSFTGSYSALNSRAPPRYHAMRGLRLGLGIQMHESPDFPSWSDVQKTFPRAIPQDVYKSGTEDDDDNSWDDRSTLFEIFDPTTVDVDFDRSCLDILDAQLLINPFEAFADVCWADAVNEPSAHDDSSHIRSPGPRYGSQPAIEHSDDEEDDDDYPDECETPRGNSPSTPIYHPAVPSRTKAVGQSFPPPKFTDPFSDSPISENGKRSFLFFEPHFTTFHPSESIGYSPSRPQRTTLASRFAGYFHNRAK